MSIVVRDLRKSYGSLVAVRDIDFDVEGGSLFALLGTNGAGKSTTIGCLTTVLTADAGTAIIDGLRLGHDDSAIRRAIGVVFQTSVLDPALTVRGNLTSRAALYGLTRSERESRIIELARMLDLTGFLERRYGTLSGGQRRRADIARALIHRPSVIFLDEPTAGLDPQSREHVWSAVRHLRQSQGTTVVLTTHYMEETAAADSVCIIDRGEIVAQGTPSELRRRYSSSVLTLRFADDDTGSRFLHAQGLPFSKERDFFAVRVESSEQAHSILNSGGGQVLDFEFRHGTMDDVFLALTNRGAE